MNGKYMTVDGLPVEINGEKNLLEVIRKAGIEMPTFCYYSELSVYGACRMCMVEDERGGIEAACSTPPREGMNIKTNTLRLRKYRKNILELLLSNHCRDCTSCEKSGNCKLQELAAKFGIDRVRFDNTNPEPRLDLSSVSITRDASKCIMCGDCVRMCNEIQNVGAIDFAYRGSHIEVSTPFGMPLGETNCVGCGQCAAVCPTGAIVVKNDSDRVWQAINDDEWRVVAQIAPAVRVAVGKALGLPDTADAMGKITAALRRIGFNEVFDTSTGADLTVLEEAQEFVERVESGENLPLFTSCCPAWVRYAENRYPELLKNLSTCRSPMQMFAPVIKEQYAHGTRRKTFMVAIMPCTAKKFEAVRPEFNDKEGNPYVDAVLTSQELVRMIRESGLVFSEIEPEAVDMPFSSMSGAGVIFGVTGGVTEAVIRRLASDKSTAGLRAIELTGVRGMEGVKEATIQYGGIDVHIAVVSGLKNADELIKRVKSGEVTYHLIEVMACPGGCVAGAGQPFARAAEKKERGDSLYRADRMSGIKRSEENPLMMALYNGVLKGRVHELLHVNYEKKGE